MHVFFMRYIYVSDWQIKLKTSSSIYRNGINISQGMVFKLTTINLNFTIIVMKTQNINKQFQLSNFVPINFTVTKVMKIQKNKNKTATAIQNALFMFKMLQIFFFVYKFTKLLVGTLLKSVDCYIVNVYSQFGLFIIGFSCWNEFYIFARRILMDFV